MEGDFKDLVLGLFKENKWRDILKLNLNPVEARKLLWVWPSETNLIFIKTAVEEFGLNGIISIGCGCGLLEWCLQQSTGLSVVGYEVNEKWWSSKYCNPQFIKLIFPELPLTSNSLSSKQALLFCYFNSGPDFRNYIAAYNGPLVFIIGPAPGVGRHTDPEPFNPDFGTSEWRLHKHEEVYDTGDFIATYIKLQSI